MTTNIRTRLFLTVLFACGAVVVGMHFFTQWAFDRGFLEYVNVQQARKLDSLAGRLQQVYEEDGGWTRLQERKVNWARILVEFFGSGYLDARIRIHLMTGKPGIWPPQRGSVPPLNSLPPMIFRLMLLDADKSVIYGRDKDFDRLQLRPIKSNQVTVGYLGILPDPSPAEQHALKFAQQLGESFVLIALFMILVSTVLSLPLAHRFLKPMRALQAATQNMASGDYSVRIKVAGDDELGRLARDFNDLGKALEHNEQLRRQWVADISHELRTPLAILRGEIEALQDGVREPTPVAIASLHGEVQHLTRLVGDLYELSMSDVGALTYRKRDINPLALLTDAITGMAGEFQAADIALDASRIRDRTVILIGDKDRFSQLFNNLLSNSLRYTDHGGRLEVAASVQEGRLHIDFADSPPGVAEQDLSKLFDRLYRVEGSRSRAHGGAGLGLAICHNIVTAHDGSISAGASRLGGLWIHIELPINGSQSK